jgi:hypothetical protein
LKKAAAAVAAYFKVPTQNLPRKAYENLVAQMRLEPCTYSIITAPICSDQDSCCNANNTNGTSFTTTVGQHHILKETLTVAAVSPTTERMIKLSLHLH